MAKRDDKRRKMFVENMAEGMTADSAANSAGYGHSAASDLKNDPDIQYEIELHQRVNAMAKNYTRMEHLRLLLLFANDERRDERARSSVLGLIGKICGFEAKDTNNDPNTIIQIINEAFPDKQLVMENIRLKEENARLRAMLQIAEQSRQVPHITPPQVSR